MNYRHAFHAGNHADVLKHIVLLMCLDALKRKPAPFAVLDTHAGCGAYDLLSDEALRSPEWQDGIARLWEWADAPAPVMRYLAAVRAFNGDGALRNYPGSPALIAAALRRPSDARGRPTFVRPVRNPCCPVMNDARPAVQLCSA